MNVRRFAILLVWLPCFAIAQGFAGLGTDAENFALPQRGYEFEFPQDHGPHNDFRIEWWYVTANLESEDGTSYGIQWTLFRNALEPSEANGWGLEQVYMGHAALTTPDEHFAAERYGRGGTGQAGGTSTELDAWIDDWTLTEQAISAKGQDFAFDLSIMDFGALVFHGDEGYSVKSSQGQASHYYSAPFIKVEGTLSLPKGEVKVSGNAWLDREWSSQPLSSDQTGWDWFSISFDSGEKLMGFLLRGSSDFTQATWIGADGQVEAFENGSFQAKPLKWSGTSGPKVPTVWKVTLPAKEIDVTVSALNPDAWLSVSIPYWEGPVTVAGTKSGRGYLEMTGY